MSVYYRYFRAESGPLVDGVKRIERENEASIEQWQVLIDEFKAASICFNSDGKIAAVAFKDTPDVRLWRPVRNGYLPKRNSKAGRALWQKIENAPIAIDPSMALRAAGLEPLGPTLIHDGYGYYNQLNTAQGVCFIRVPWLDVPDAEMTEYREKNAAGIHSSCSMDHLQWTPPAGLVELKEWEFLRDWEQLTQTQEHAA